MSQKLFHLSQFFLSHVPDNAWALLGTGIVFLGFWMVGRLLWRRSAGEAALAGWSMLYLFSVAAAVSGLTDLRWIAALFLALVVVALLVLKRDVLPTRGGWIALLLLSPVALFALLMPLMHWDSYWHWVLNGSYLYRFHRFPVLPLEGFPSFHPTYPMATSLVYYFSSLVTARFLQTTGLFMNLMLTLVALDCVTRLLREQSRDLGVSESGPLYRYGLPVAALCMVLSLNPSFRAVNYFSAIADPALGVIVLVMIVRWSDFIATARAGSAAAMVSPRLTQLLSHRESARELLLLFMLGALIGGVKHSGWVLALILSASGALVGIVRRAPWPRWLAPAVAVFSGTVLSQVLWSTYRSANLAIPGQFSIRPLSEWRFDLLPGLLQGMRADLGVEPFYYALLALTTLVGLIALLRRSFVPNERLTLMLAFVGVAMPLHFASLFLAYLGTGFNEMEILRAASLHRYSSHIGFAACVFGLITAAAFLMRRAARSAFVLSAKHTVLAALVLYVLPLGFNVLLPSLFAGSYYLKTYQSLHDSAASISNIVPAQDGVALFGPDWAINFGSYHMWRPLNGSAGPVFKDRKIVASAADLPSASEYMKQWMADQSIDHIWLFDAQVLSTALGHPHARHILWSRSTREWRVVHETPEVSENKIDTLQAQR